MGNNLVRWAQGTLESFQERGRDVEVLFSLCTWTRMMAANIWVQADGRLKRPYRKGAKAVFSVDQVRVTWVSKSMWVYH